MAMANPLEIGVSIGKSPINSVFSIAMFDYGRVVEILVESHVGVKFHQSQFFFQDTKSEVFLVGDDWNMTGLFFHILEMSSSQLTNSYFSEGIKLTTNQIMIDYP